MRAAEKPGAALFLFPHHDDEVFCTGPLSAALRQGRDVRILWVTAGGTAPARRRVREGEAALRAMRAEVTHRSLGLPDQGMLDHLPEVAAALTDMLRGATDAYVPAYEGGHPDHDAANLAAARVARGRVRVHEFSLYRRAPLRDCVKAPFPGEPGPRERFRLDRRARQLRRRLVLANLSQFPELLLLAAGALLGGRLSLEPLRDLPEHDYQCPPFGRPPLYEVYTRRRFEEFRSAAEHIW